MDPLNLTSSDLRRAVHCLDQAIEQDPANVRRPLRPGSGIYNNLGAHNHSAMRL